MEANSQKIESKFVKPTLTPDVTVYDFGNVLKGSTNDGLFILTNTSNKDVIITNARASCGCTQPTLEKMLLHPNETTEVKIRYTAPPKEGGIAKQVTIFYNWELVHNNKALAEDNKKLTAQILKLDIKGTII